MQVHRLEQSSAVKQALVDVYSAECARLQSEVKRLSVADVVTSTEGSQHLHRHHRQKQQQQQQSSPVVSRDSSAAADIQKMSQVSRTWCN